MMNAYRSTFDALLDAIKRADDRYWNMSGGYWLAQAPEYYLTVRLAEALFRRGVGLVSLEESRLRVMKDCGLQDGRFYRHAWLRRRGRCDIVVWHPGDRTCKERPIAAVEVKCGVYARRQLIWDCRWIIRMLEVAPQFEFGFLVCQIEGDTKDRSIAADVYRQRVSLVEQVALELSSNRNVVPELRETAHHADKESISGVAIVGFRRNSSAQ